VSKSSIVRVNLSQLSIDFPEAPKGIDKRATSAIKNAWEQGSIIDSRGILWVQTDKLSAIWRTDKPTAKELYLQIPKGKFRREIGGCQYIRGCEVLKFIAYRLETSVSKRREGLIYARDIFTSIQDSADLDLISHKAEFALQSAKKVLKKERIKKYQIGDDELTGEALEKKTSHFSHIVSAASDLELADQIWNGLVVNKETHILITKEKVTNADELYTLCTDQKWRIDWYSNWKDQLDIFYSG
jgi:hypothetical protein